MKRGLNLELLLKDSRNYSISEINNLLTESNISFLIRNFLNFLNKNITNPEIEDKIYLLKIFYYLPQFINKSHHLNKESINNKIIKIMDNVKNHLDKENKDYELLKEVLLQLENLSVMLMYDLNIENCSSKYSLINYIVFDNCNEIMFKKIITKYPYLVNISDENKESLITKLVRQYLIELDKYADNKYKQKLIYYDHIIDFVLSSKRLKLSYEDKVVMLNKIEEALDNLKSDIDLGDSKEEILSWLVNLKNKLVITINNSKKESIITRYGIDTNFSEKIVKEYTKYLGFPKVKRVVITEATIAIDAKNALMLDDALSIKELDNKNFLLGVHITEVANRIDYNQMLLEDIIKRGKTIYLSDESLPIMPTNVIGKISLTPNTRRLCKSYYFEIDNRGNVLDFLMKKEIIMLSNKLSYKYVNNVLKSEAYDNPVKELLFKLLEITKAINTQDPVNPLYILYKRKQNKEFAFNSPAAKIVETCMLLPNSFTAKLSSENNTPFLYRNHVIDDKLKKDMAQLTSSLLWDLESIGLKELVNNLVDSFPSGYYSEKNKGHAGLNKESYGQITSPGRRGGSIVNELCIDTCYFKNPSNQEVYYLENLVQESAKILNEKDICIEEFIRQYTKK
ncbi:MAG: RNB domain-containing ribonuclease [Bacilli bacterium]